MIEVVERKCIPVYEVECHECKSTLRYTRADMYTTAVIYTPEFIKCPVCGVSINVIPTKGSHVALMGGNGGLPKGCASCDNKCRLYQSRALESQNPVPMAYLQENRLVGCPLEGEESCLKE